MTTTTLRLNVMRFLYLLNFALLGYDVWPAIVRHAGAWEPMRGVAFSFWAALATISGLGLRYPLKMVPVLLLQLLYKSIWVAAVAMPNWAIVRSTGLANAMLIGIVLDVVVIPWPYVLRTFVTERGDRWVTSRDTPAVSRAAPPN